MVKNDGLKLFCRNTHGLLLFLGVMANHAKGHDVISSDFAVALEFYLSFAHPHRGFVLGCRGQLATMDCLYSGGYHCKDDFYTGSKYFSGKRPGKVRF